MTSELRPAVEVWRQAHQALYWLPKGTVGEQGAAAVIEADREAVRAEQAAEVERLTQCLAKANASMEEYERKFYLADDELAKYKALAETLAGALEKIAEGTYPRPLGKPWRMDASSSKHDRCIHDAWMYETCEGCLDAFVAEALLQYKEASDETSTL